MQTIVPIFITVYAAYNIFNNDDTLKKIERWLYLIAFILFNILIKLT